VFFYNTVVAQAYRVDVTPSRITFTFLANQKVPRQQCEDMKAFLEDIAEKIAGTRIPVAVVTADGAASAAPIASASARSELPASYGETSPKRPAGREGGPTAPAAPAAPGPPAAPASSGSTAEDLRQAALSDPSVQALLEIFPVEKTKIEEM
jgi:hypothetical protein